ncbi:uncharacterized protein M421DRAFT_89614 [Didymella exigua CBS 183.55]|uniref:Uncharacterized protein n=1 Tax=Didymella exigua CBS 183.55 TaxID=1150837 RepID=A0A6A5RV04_9PLEO|nr:uncharacterized protein M421DRAFT_89614 [Didymella exigua CBS 183.55]KAF1932295.1 hypothetical protein M421DRAFT_89614 [Didymella exigua CBS 183.55]
MCSNFDRVRGGIQELPSFYRGSLSSWGPFISAILDLWRDAGHCRENTGARRMPLVQRDAIISQTRRAALKDPKSHECRSWWVSLRVLGVDNGFVDRGDDWAYETGPIRCKLQNIPHSTKLRLLYLNVAAAPLPKFTLPPKARFPSTPSLRPKTTLNQRLSSPVAITQVKHLYAARPSQAVRFACSANGTAAPSKIRSSRSHVGHNSCSKRDVTLRNEVPLLDVSSSDGGSFARTETAVGTRSKHLWIVLESRVKSMATRELSRELVTHVPCDDPVHLPLPL